MQTYLNMSKLRSDVRITRVDDEWEVYQVFPAPLPSGSSRECNTAQLTEHARNLLVKGWHLDPRSTCLGLRAVVPKDSIESNTLKELRRQMLSGVCGDPSSEEMFRALRYRFGIAEGSSEMAQGLPLEYNLAGRKQLGCSTLKNRSDLRHLYYVLLL